MQSRYHFFNREFEARNLLFGIKVEKNVPNNTRVAIWLYNRKTFEIG